MNQLRQILKIAKVSASQLSEAMGMPERTLSYQFTTGRVPYALVYKISLVTGVTMDELVPKFLAEQWLYLFEQQNKLNKPRGKKKAWRSGDNEKQKRSNVSRGTPTPETSPDIPKSVTPEKPAKKSIADLMKETPVTPSPLEIAPDFSNIPDDLFNTSMDTNNNPAKKRKP